MTKHEKALQAAEVIKEYCQSIPTGCKGCVFNQNDKNSIFYKGCKLNDPDHLPETWQIEQEVEE